MHCINDYKTTDTLSSAVELCEKDKECGLFYNNACNDEGPFKLCRNFTDLRNSTSETCVYTKRGNNYHIDTFRFVNCLILMLLYF